jgi:hypothetical protein
MERSEAAVMRSEEVNPLAAAAAVGSEKPATVSAARPEAKRPAADFAAGRRLEAETRDADCADGSVGVVETPAGSRVRILNRGVSVVYVGDDAMPIINNREWSKGADGCSRMSSMQDSSDDLPEEECTVTCEAGRRRISVGGPEDRSDDLSEEDGTCEAGRRRISVGGREERCHDLSEEDGTCEAGRRRISVGGPEDRSVAAAVAAASSYQVRIITTVKLVKIDSEG